MNDEHKTNTCESESTEEKQKIPQQKSSIILTRDQRVELRIETALDGLGIMNCIIF